MSGLFTLALVLVIACVLGGVFGVVDWTLNRMLARGRRRRAAQHMEDVYRHLAAQRKGGWR